MDLLPIAVTSAVIISLVETCVDLVVNISYKRKRFVNTHLDSREM